MNTTYVYTQKDVELFRRNFNIANAKYGCGYYFVCSNPACPIKEPGFPIDRPCHLPQGEWDVFSPERYVEEMKRSRKIMAEKAGENHGSNQT